MVVQASNGYAARAEMFGTGSEADVTEAGGTVPSTVVGIVAIFGTSFADNFGRSWRAGERWPQVPRQ